MMLWWWGVRRSSFVLVSLLFLSRPALAERTTEEKPQSEQTRPALPRTGGSAASAGLGDIDEIRPQSMLFRMLGSSLYAASGADLVTTEWGLTHPHLQEGNPLASNRAVRISTHVLGPATVHWTTEKLHQSGRRKLALILRIGVVAAYGYATVHNLRKVSSSPIP